MPNFKRFKKVCSVGCAGAARLRLSARAPVPFPARLPSSPIGSFGSGLFVRTLLLLLLSWLRFLLLAAAVLVFHAKLSSSQIKQMEHEEEGKK